MQATLITLALISGAVPTAAVSHHATVPEPTVAGAAYVPPVWYESIFCCGGNMPQTCYEPRFGCYSGTSRFTHRYPAFHGTHYRRPYNYRQYFDYPWHAALHEPTSMFAYNVEEVVPTRAPPAPRGAASSARSDSYARSARSSEAEKDLDESQQGSIIVPTVDPGYLKYLINEVAKGVTESNEQKEEARRAAAESKEHPSQETAAQINQVTHLDPRTLAAALNAVQSAQLFSETPASPSEVVAPVEPDLQPIESVVVKATPLDSKSPASQWRRREATDKK